MFSLHSTSGHARRGILETARGDIQTPFFMTIATVGAVKGLLPSDVRNLGGQILLSNTYHLHLRPGEDVVARAGGLHKFMAWEGPILTDSGGYQVFSLAKIRKIKPEGVEFQSHLDGATIYLTPEKAMEIQAALGSDIHMVLDECPAADADRDYIEKSLVLTTEWARRSRQAASPEALVFGIVQGGMHSDLRRRSAEALVKIGFDGYAIGGLSVGEPSEVMYDMISATVPGLPTDKPRYLMGVGTPVDILEAVERGIDMLDCVLPTRNARHGTLYTSKGIIRIKNEAFKDDFSPLDPQCTCETCAVFTKAYLRHLFVSGEILSHRLNTLHNVAFYLKLMKDIREAIEGDRFAAFKKDFLSTFQE